MNQTESRQSVYVKIVKKADDPEGITRVSLGTGEAEGERFLYLVYRGTKEDALTCLAHAIASLHKMNEKLGPDREPDISADEEL